MNREQYINKLLRILQTLNEPQLHYIYKYVLGYFDIEDSDEDSHPAPATNFK